MTRGAAAWSSAEPGPYWLLFLRKGYKRHSASGMRVVFVFSDIKTDQRLRSFWQTLERFCQEQRDEHTRFNEAQARLAASQGRVRRPVPGIEIFAECFRLGRWDQLREANILTDPVWHTHEGDTVPFFRGSVPTQPTETTPRPALHLVADEGASP